MRPTRRGANGIEFALVLPVLLVFTFGIIDLGWAYLLRHAAGSAAGIGARAGALTSQEEDPAGEALVAANARWAELGLPASAKIEAAQSGAPSMMEVRVAVDMDALVGFVPGLPGSIEVTAVQRMEDQP